MTDRPDDPASGLSAEERAAIRDRARELKADARRAKSADARAESEREVRERIAAMPDPDRVLGERVAALVAAVAPDLVPRLWYGMPAWAREGKVLCFFQDAAKFKARYATLGFTDTAALDDGPMWPASFALVAVTPEVEARIAELLRRAAAA